MMAQNDGGPAFPHDGRDNGPGNIKGRAHDGMALRDWFAGQALPAIIVVTSEGNHNPVKKHGCEVERAIAIDAYAIADAMIAAREATDAV